MQAIHMTWTRLVSLGRALGQETKAETAVEFAMIGTAFFFFIFGIFYFAVVQFWQLVLDDAVRSAARQVQIGNITTGPPDGVTPTHSFVTYVCNEFGAAAPGCAANLQYSVQGGAYFSAITPVTLSAAGNLSTTAQWSGVTATSSGAPVYLLVQVAFPVPLKTPLLLKALGTENGTPSLYSSVATVMEP